MIDVTKLVDPTLSSEEDYYEKELNVLEKHHKTFIYLLRRHSWDFAF